MYHDTLNQALDSVGLGDMLALDVDAKIGSMQYGDTKRFQHDGKQVAIYRMDSGRYEITAYKM